METTSNTRLEELLVQVGAMHKHLCPRQVLGVRMGMCAAGNFGLAFPQEDKRVLAFVESDGCFADGVSVATGCTMGHRTMRLVDYGKVAATFVDLNRGRAIRIAPRDGVRQRAVELVAGAPTRWRAQLEGYQKMLNQELFVVNEVALNLDLKAIVGKPGVRANCARCGEEVLNQREVMRDGEILCRSCAGDSYWRAI